MEPWRLFKAIRPRAVKGHFGQWGEDVAIHKLFDRRFCDGRYLDIGAFDPFRHSNTAYLWLKGWSGVNVDADVRAIARFRRTRPADQNIHAALVSSAFIKAHADTDSCVTLFTPKRADAERASATSTCDPAVATERGFDEKGVQVPALTFPMLLSEIVDPRAFDYMNIDIEGFDASVLSEVDWSRIRPRVVSIEDYANNVEEAISSQIGTVMRDAGYSLVARVGPTSIFHLS